MYRIISFGKTDCGLRRPNNEDAFLVKLEFGFVWWPMVWGSGRR